MLDARIIGYDAQTDIALLKIDGEDFPYCALGNSENLSVIFLKLKEATEAPI